jgi:hypothetical protein
MMNDQSEPFEEVGKPLPSPIEPPDGPGSESYLDLNEAESLWIGECADQARVLCAKYLPSAPLSRLEPSVLDSAYSRWLADWQTGKVTEDPNTVVNSTGIAFGQWLVASLGMEWTVVSDSIGTDMGVRYCGPTNRVVVFPTHFVAKRLELHESDFFEPFYDQIRVQIERSAEN